MQALTKDSFIPSGKYAGTKMSEVPPDYLLYVYENKLCGMLVMEYVKKNLDQLKEQKRILDNKKKYLYR